MALSTGTAAPTLALHDTDGNAVALSDYTGESAVLMYFMRATTCPPCNAHVQQLVSQADDLSAQGVDVIIALPEGRTEVASWKKQRKVPFTTVTGESGSAHAEFGLTRKVFGSIQQSGTILIDRDGVVRYVHAGTNPMAAYNRAETDKAIAAL